MRPNEPLLLVATIIILGSCVAFVAMIGQAFAEVERLVKNTFLGE